MTINNDKGHLHFLQSTCDIGDPPPRAPRVCALYTDHAGPEIPVHLIIAWPFSRQIANGNAGPSLALDSMGPKLSVRCHLLNIAPIYKQ